MDFRIVEILETHRMLPTYVIKNKLNQLDKRKILTTLQVRTKLKQLEKYKRVKRNLASSANSIVWELCT